MLLVLTLRTPCSAAIVGATISDPPWLFDPPRTR